MTNDSPPVLIATKNAKTVAETISSQRWNVR